MDADKNIHSGHRQRLKNRFLADGLRSFNEINTLEVLLFYAVPRKDTNPIAHRLLDRFGSLSAVLEAEPALLTEVDGVSEHGALLIKLVASLAHDYINGARSAAEQIRFTDLDELGQYIVSQFIGLNRETVMVFSLDASCRITGRKILFCGSFRDAKVSAADLSRFAIASGAEFVVLAHNHPSGTLIPSETDVSTTRRLFHALHTVGIHLGEHFIVAGGKYMPTMCNSTSYNGFERLPFAEDEE